MKELAYVTGNAIKFLQGKAACEAFGIALTQTGADIIEIQANTGEPVARDKAQKAFEQLGKPLVISDDSWSIPGLKGFPGPYMKDINEWFTPQDFLRLTSELKDRRIILRQIVVYQDAHVQKLFSFDIEGMLLKDARGMSKYPHSYITSFDGGKTSSAEHHARGTTPHASQRDVWHDFAEWYTVRQP
jgi:inosine/xanthosine triphosphate pyrophosphatase family protein